MLNVTDRWRAVYPGAVVGVLALEGVRNPKSDRQLELQKADLIEHLRNVYQGYNRSALREIPVLQAYRAYYKGFKKTYHVLLQLESVALKGKPLPRVAALVEAVFMAELKNLLLTAAHDLDTIQGSLLLDIAQGDEKYIRLNGQEGQLKKGDMFIADDRNVISSVLYGPDRRTRIQPTTERLLVTIYAPPGIPGDHVNAHMDDIRNMVNLFSPQSKVSFQKTYSAGNESKPR